VLDKFSLKYFGSEHSITGIETSGSYGLDNGKGRHSVIQKAVRRLEGVQNAIIRHEISLSKSMVREVLRFSLSLQPFNTPLEGLFGRPASQEPT